MSDASKFVLVPIPAGKTFLNLSGHKFGRWDVIRFLFRNKGKTWWLCRCSCGTERPVATSGLRDGTSISCGCFRAEILGNRSRTHGKKLTPEFKAWVHMRQRCLNPKCKMFKDYGARGITVCERWSDFYAFDHDMGPKPTPKHSLDRIDNNGNYEPGNCRWATPVQQSNNRRSSLFVEYLGEKDTLANWCRRLGINYYKAWSRISKGVSLEFVVDGVNH